MKVVRSKNKKGRRKMENNLPDIWKCREKRGAPLCSSLSLGYRVADFVPEACDELRKMEKGKL